MNASAWIGTSLTRFSGGEGVALYVDGLDNDCDKLIVEGCNILTIGGFAKPS